MTSGRAFPDDPAKDVNEEVPGGSMSIPPRFTAVSAAMCVVTMLAAAPPQRPTIPPAQQRASTSGERPTSTPGGTSRSVGGDRPNILFVVMDDIGIDAASWQPFGWNAAPNPPLMPVMQAIADDAVSFTNFWATPECSPSRACFLTGRWGHRTGVTTAIVDPMLPANHLNPAEVTLPKILKNAGYAVGMIGKYHLAGAPPYTPPGHGFEAPASTVGLDRYEGYWSLPPSIDHTVGGQSDLADAPCGFPMVDQGIVGAACFPSGSCADGTLVWGDCRNDVSPLEALALGGLPLLDGFGNLATDCGDCGAIQVCDDRGAYISDFMNAYYAWPEVRVAANGTHTPEYPEVDPTRQHLTDWISRRSAEWITAREATGEPWMCMVTHSAAHTPLQTPPPGPAGIWPTGLNCTLPTLDPNVQYREVYTRMIEHLDESLGRMLLGLGLATLDGTGYHLVDLAERNIMLVVMADNGSYGYTVFEPFDASRSKQTVYQTGVWVPCMVAGAGVNTTPGARTAVAHPVDVVDLFELFCTAAGVDPYLAVQTAAPGRVVDARPMTPYIQDPTRESIRQYDFAVYQAGMFGATPGSSDWEQGGIAGACANGTLLIDQLISDESLCNANGGVWLGDYSYCDLLEIWQEDPCDPRLQGYDLSNPFATSIICGIGCGGQALRCLAAPNRGQWAIRRDQYKLVVTQFPSCLPEDVRCRLEFYRLPDFEPPDIAGIERDDDQLDIDDLGPVEQAILDDLRREMRAILESTPYCPGDGNLDGRVDMEDLTAAIADWGAPSWWDLDRDGLITGADIGLLIANWNPDCATDTVPRVDLPYNDPAYIPDCL